MDEDRPDAVKNADRDPALERPMDRTIIREVAGQLVPLAAGAQAEDDGIQRRAAVNALAARLLRWIKFGEHGLDVLPQRIGHAPNRWQGFGLLRHADSLTCFEIVT